MKRLIIWLLIFTTSCSPDFNTPRYKKTFQTRHGWKRKNIVIFKQDIYRNPIVKPETKRELLNPKIINLDKW